MPLSQLMPLGISNWLARLAAFAALIHAPPHRPLGIAPGLKGRDRNKWIHADSRGMVKMKNL